MAAANNLATEPNDRVLVIERVFDAPRALVFKAWTEPERLMKWWGPRGYAMTFCELDLRPGGAYRFHMRSPEGTDHRAHGIFREVVPPERLTMAGAWVDPTANPGHETTMTITLADLGGKTKLTLHQEVFESISARDAHNGGWTSALDCLAEYLAAA